MIRKKDSKTDTTCLRRFPYNTPKGIYSTDVKFLNRSMRALAIDCRMDCEASGGNGISGSSA